jgi:Homing endonuclease associated repeat/HNH endonuclease
MSYAKQTHRLAAPRAGETPSQKPIQFKPEPFHFAIPDQVLIEDLQDVARRLRAASVFAQQYDKHGRFTAATLRQRFGSWNAALEAAGLLASAPRLVEDQAMLDDIAAVAKKLGVNLLPNDQYRQHGRYSVTNIRRRFGSWNRAVTAAGLTAAASPQRNPSAENLFNNFEMIWRHLGRQPRGRDLAPPLSRFGLKVYHKKFGTFRKALAHFLAHQKQLGKTTTSAISVELPPRHKTPREVRAKLRYQVLNRDHFKCRFCGRSPATDPTVQLCIDHKHPWSLGGETVVENLQTLCDQCNAGKSNAAGGSAEGEV